MLYEPTTLASATALLATALREEYGIDPVPIFFQADYPLVTFAWNPIRGASSYRLEVFKDENFEASI